MESVFTITDEAIAVPGTEKSVTMESEVTTDETSNRSRLFTDVELDAMDACEPGQEATVLAGVEVAVETEEYEKELEDRLYPLDEVELKRRIKVIEETEKEPSIEAMSKYLGIPVEVLERSRKTLHGGSIYT
ncbi:hypothetical protein PI124_g13547 [Phytophthora idaei]|nr:hypothetical protein PI125_g14362 [Phytophthora idaei]KAG3145841.1 hypothetical protein PI126_g13570 [Phytophthora idaei]KAG3241595.1 hypothetical protein PI124_g13547 [Phytophthora idaei]